MEYVAFEKGIEINGRTVWAVVDGFRSFGLLASEYLLAEGIGEKAADGMARIPPGAWYPQEAWLRAFSRIGDRVGDAVLYRIGLTIPSNARFPDRLKGLHEALRLLDVAYHMNHRKHGRELFDPANGELTEGIGHYGFEEIAGQKLIRLECRNPYPCAFDLGILTALAQQHEGTAMVVHDDARPCRKRGDESCTYLIRWR